MTADFINGLLDPHPAEHRRREQRRQHHQRQARGAEALRRGRFQHRVVVQATGEAGQGVTARRIDLLTSLAHGGKRTY